MLETSLHPGDRLLMFSDDRRRGRSATGEFLGLAWLLDLLAPTRGGRPAAPETLRRPFVAVFEHQEKMLQDDATVLVLK